MTIDQYINSISNRYKLGNSTEHSFRGDLQQLIESTVPEIKATNEPKRQQCGAPDYIITRKEIPLGFIEAKDIGADLDNKLYKEQFDRYRQSLDNLIITDYLTFRLYRDSIFVSSITIGKVQGNKIIGVARHQGGEGFGAWQKNAVDALNAGADLGVAEFVTGFAAHQYPFGNQGGNGLV